MAYTPGKGTVIKLSIATVYTEVPQATGITPPGMEMGDTETTHLKSPAREHQANILDGGEAGFNIEFDPANAVHMQLWTSFKAGTLEDWRIVLADAGAAEIDFKSYVKGFPFDEITVENVVTLPIGLQVSGLPVITA